MITWAIAWMFVQMSHWAEGISLPIGLFVITGMFDIVIIFLIGCAIKGWPKL